MARIQEYQLKSGATVTMHSRLSMTEALDLEDRRAAARKHKSSLSKVWSTLTIFVTGWTLRDVETDELLPFTRDGFARADMVDVAEITEMMNRVEAGEAPNAPSESSPGTSDEDSR